MTVVVGVFAFTMGACGGSPHSLVDGAGESQGARTSVDQSTTQAIACVQGTLRDCTVQLPTQGAVHNCFSGKQLCSGGSWTNCQDPSTLVGVRTQTFTASCPAGETIRWTTLDYALDTPTNPSGVAAVTMSVAGHPELPLLDVSSIDLATDQGGAGSRNVGPLLGALAGQAELALQITTTTTPDGAMAATATGTLSYSCGGSP